jgi:hypothetical protein
VPAREPDAQRRRPRRAECRAGSHAELRPGRRGSVRPARDRGASAGRDGGGASADGHRRDRVRRVRPHHHREGLAPAFRGVIRPASFAIRRPGRVRQARSSGAGPGRYASCRSTFTAVPKKGPRRGPARGGQRKGTVIGPAGSSRVRAAAGARQSSRSERRSTRGSAPGSPHVLERDASSDSRRRDRRAPEADAHRSARGTHRSRMRCIAPDPSSTIASRTVRDRVRDAEAY